MERIEGGGAPYPVVMEWEKTRHTGSSMSMIMNLSDSIRDRGSVRARKRRDFEEAQKEARRIQDKADKSAQAAMMERSTSARGILGPIRNESDLQTSFSALAAGLPVPKRPASRSNTPRGTTVARSRTAGRLRGDLSGRAAPKDSAITPPPSANSSAGTPKGPTQVVASVRPRSAGRRRGPHVVEGKPWLHGSARGGGTGGGVVSRKASLEGGRPMSDRQNPEEQKRSRSVYAERSKTQSGDVTRKPGTATEPCTRPASPKVEQASVKQPRPQSAKRPDKEDNVNHLKRMLKELEESMDIRSTEIEGGVGSAKGSRPGSASSAQVRPSSLTESNPAGEMQLSEQVMLEYSVSNPGTGESTEQLHEVTAVEIAFIPVKGFHSGTLRQCANLRTLHLICTGLSDLSHLEHVYTLATLNVTGNKLTELSSLDCFPNLTELVADENEISIVDGLGHCQRLRLLRLNSNRIRAISDLSGLSGCQSLTELQLADNRLRSLNGIETFAVRSPLEVLNLSGNDISRLSELHFLRPMQNLRRLWLDDPHFEPGPLPAKKDYAQIVGAALSQITHLDGQEIRASAERCFSLGLWRFYQDGALWLEFEVDGDANGQVADQMHADQRVLASIRACCKCEHCLGFTPEPNSMEVEVAEWLAAQNDGFTVEYIQSSHGAVAFKDNNGGVHFGGINRCARFGFGHETADLHVPRPWIPPHQIDVASIAFGYAHTILVTREGMVYVAGKIVLDEMASSTKIAAGDGLKTASEQAPTMAPRFVPIKFFKALPVHTAVCCGDATVVISREHICYTFGWRLVSRNPGEPEVLHMTRQLKVSEFAFGSTEDSDCVCVNTEGKIHTLTPTRLSPFSTKATPFTALQSFSTQAVRIAEDNTAIALTLPYKSRNDDTLAPQLWMWNVAKSGNILTVRGPSNVTVIDVCASGDVVAILTSKNDVYVTSKSDIIAAATRIPIPSNQEDTENEANAQSDSPRKVTPRTSKPPVSSRRGGITWRCLTTTSKLRPRRVLFARDCLSAYTPGQGLRLWPPRKLAGNQNTT